MCLSGTEILWDIGLGNILGFASEEILNSRLSDKTIYSRGAYSSIVRVLLTIAVILILVVAGVGAILIAGSRPSGVTKTTAGSTTTGGTSSVSLEQSTGAQVTSTAVATNSGQPTNPTGIVSENEADNRSLGILGPSLASTLNSSSGLRLDLQLAAVPPHNITITVDDFNTLGQVNNVTAANGWRIPSAGCPPYSPAGRRRTSLSILLSSKGIRDRQPHGSETIALDAAATSSKLSI